MSDTAQSKQERFVVVNEDGAKLTKPLPREEIPEKLSQLQEAEDNAGQLSTRQVLEE